MGKIIQGEFATRENMKSKCIARKNLTKTFLMELPENRYLVSNIYERNGVPAFAEHVAPIARREKQWKRIVRAGVDYRLCNVFKTKEDYQYDSRIIFNE